MLSNAVLGAQREMNSSMSLGFDIGTIIEAINAVNNNQQIGVFERDSLTRAVKFFSAVVHFCRGEHYLFTSDISSGEAFSIYVNALNYEGTLDSIKENAERHVCYLERILSGNTKWEEAKELVEVFKSISNYSDVASINEYNPILSNWRL